MGQDICQKAGRHGCLEVEYQTAATMNGIRLQNGSETCSKPGHQGAVHKTGDEMQIIRSYSIFLIETALAPFSSMPGLSTTSRAIKSFFVSSKM